ncbi:hypothetical protein Tco_0174926 [Tanacetum coccineum]
MTSFNQRECKGCGQPCDGFYCYLCTCQQCGVKLINGICLNCTYGDGKPVTCCGCEGPLNGGFCSFCASRAGNSFAYDPNPNSFNDSQNLSDYPPQPQYQTYSCELCGNDAHYGYDCPPQVPFVYNQDPCFNQNFDNNFPQTSPSFPQQYLCCENCGGPHATFQCQPMNQNFYNSSGFDQFQPPQYPVIHHPPQETSVEILQARENLMKSIQTFLKKFNRISFRETPKVLSLAWENFFEIKHAFKEKQHQPEDIQELLHKLLKDLQMISEELADYINTPNWNCPAFYEDDDEEYTIAITPVLPTEEPDNSLSMGDEHLSTILETESDELIKSSVENLVPIPSESEDFSDIKSECDVPVCDNFTTFSNPLFDADDDFSSSDDESFSDEDVPKKIYSNPLFDEEIISTKIDLHHFNAKSDLIDSLLNRDTSIVSSPKFDSLLKEFSEIHLVEKLLYDNSSPRPPEEFNSKNSDAVIESFTPSPIPIEDSDSLIEEIDIFLAPDDSIPPGIKNDDYDSEGDILFLEELLSNDSLSLPENESFHFDRYYVPSSPRPPEKPPDDDDVYFDIEPDTRVFTKVVDDISDNSTRELYVHVPNVLPTLPNLSPMFDTLLPFSSENDDKVFNPGILASNEEKSPHLLSHRGFKAFQVISDFSESPMMIYGEDIPILDVPFLHFYPP